MCMFNHYSDCTICMTVLKKTRFAHKGNIAIVIILHILMHCIEHIFMCMSVATLNLSAARCTRTYVYT